MYLDNKGKVILDCLATLDNKKLSFCANIICEEKKRIMIWFEL
jgi:hypothetical protein